ncbi:S28 family serine protease [Hyalangium versicolor]|uniref:S28 family serine protease n=1 Tax=Hyalangium versicolor TaxID=2861190 RepID=UPI001CCC577D|nr:S28 family serine protease [Hyalangium versicolor]
MRLSERGVARGAVLFLCACLLQACGEGLPETTAVTSTRSALEAKALASGDILAQLQAIPGMTVLAEKPVPGNPSLRYFVLDYDQPADHRHPEGEHFQQRMTLLHRSAEAPMVLASTGYDLYSYQPVNTEPSYLLTANLLYVEHRFFATSTPASSNWKLLDIKQAAADHHRIIQALKPLYPASWLTTGGSKGGMTSIYHRYFYPNDVDATVAYVAPNSYLDGDPRYSLFLNKVGTAECREKLRQVQRALLQRHAEIQPFLDELTAYGITFNGLGLDKAYEFAVTEAPFTFWQYGYGVDACADIPAANAPAAALFQFLEDTNAVDLYSDEGLEPYAAYYYQSATQLGGPSYSEAHLFPLLRYPLQDRSRNFPPYGADKDYDFLSMHLVELWMKKSAQHMMLIYGENDPWSSGAFEVNPANESARYFVAGGNHGSSLYDLPAAEQSAALQQLSDWMGAPVRPYPSAAARSAAEDVPVVNPVLERRHRL